MKTTIFLKKSDLVIQGILCGLILKGLVFNSQFNNFTIALGGWQIFSAVLHTLFAESYYPSIHRRNSYAIFWVLLVFIPLCILIPFLLVFYIVLISAPCLSIYYMIACFDEIFILDRKAVVHLRK